MMVFKYREYGLGFIFFRRAWRIVKGLKLDGWLWGRRP